MKDFCVWTVGFLEVVFFARYVYQIRKREIAPTLSMWITFFLGTGLSFATYVVAEKADLRSGILNTMDAVGVTLVPIAILVWGRRAVRFRPFEKWYLACVVAIVAYALFSGDAWRSNIFTQVLLVIGYAPTIHSLITEKRNTESFSTWGCSIAAGLVAFYPATVEGNVLAMLYAIRNVVLASLLVLIMAYYERRRP